MIERVRNYGIVGVFGILFIVLAFTSPSFLSLQNGANILDQSSVLLILAATTTVCIIAGVFDLSIAAVATASAIMTVNAINAVGLVGGITLGILFGGVLGLITGVAITKTNVNSFIGTLAASFTYRGLGLILAAGGLVTGRCHRCAPRAHIGVLLCAHLCTDPDGGAPQGVALRLPRCRDRL